MSLATTNLDRPGDAGFVPGFVPAEPIRAQSAATRAESSPAGWHSRVSLTVGAGALATAVLAVLAWSTTRWSVATFLAGIAFGVGLGLLVAAGGQVRPGLGLAAVGTLLGLVGLVLGATYIGWGETIDDAVAAALGTAAVSEETAPPSPVRLVPGTFSASGQLPAIVDSTGSTVTFGPEQAFDDDLRTAWAVSGTESGQWLAAGWPSEQRVLQIVLASASEDAVRVAVAFADGTAVQAELAPGQPLTVDVDVRTTAVKVLLLAPAGGSAPDYVAVAEVQVWGEAT